MPHFYHLAFNDPIYGNPRVPYLLTGGSNASEFSAVRPVKCHSSYHLVSFSYLILYDQVEVGEGATNCLHTRKLLLETL